MNLASTLSIPQGGHFPPSPHLPRQENEQDSHTPGRSAWLSTSIWLDDKVTTRPPYLITSERTNHSRPTVTFSSTSSDIDSSQTLTMANDSSDALPVASTVGGFVEEEVVIWSDIPEHIPGKPADIAPSGPKGLDWTSTNMTAVLVVSVAGTFILCVFIAAAIMQCYRRWRGMLRSRPTARHGLVHAYGHEETTYKYGFPHGKSERRYRGYSAADLDSTSNKGSDTWGRPILKQRPPVHKSLPHCSSLTRVAPYDPNSRQLKYQSATHSAADIVRTSFVFPDQSGALLHDTVDQNTFPNPIPPRQSAPVSDRTRPFPNYQISVDISERPVPPNLQHDSASNIELWTLQNATNDMQETQDRITSLRYGPASKRVGELHRQRPPHVFQFATIERENDKQSSVI